jgi:hypothetical protein
MEVVGDLSSDRNIKKKGIKRKKTNGKSRKGRNTTIGRARVVEKNARLAKYK